MKGAKQAARNFSPVQVKSEFKDGQNNCRLGIGL